MAHDIDHSTGKPAIAYVGETPWHGLGEKLPPGASIERWLRAARLEWELERLPVQYLVQGRVRTMPGRFVLVRSDTDAALSIVSEDYQVVQPKEVLEFYRNLADLYGYTLETSGALDGGRKVWALAKTGIADIVGKDQSDELGAYLLLATSCDKTLATTATYTSIRVVCQNTLFFAMEEVEEGRRRHVKIPHTRRFNPNLVMQALKPMDTAWAEFIAKVSEFACYPMEPDEAGLYFKAVLVPENKDFSDKTWLEHETICSLYRSAPGQDLPSARKTLWGAVNAVTYYADHVRSESSADRLNSAWFGAGDGLKERAWTQASQLVSPAPAVPFL
ncbi:MAG: DUF932 domain-containing protein [Candidatus Solibacter usitatus]|nr:DUF932 domain-containing protein [Candidatus Solibacter usitatus]